VSARVRKRLASRKSVLFNHEQVAAALYMATGGLIDLWGECRACKAHGLSALCIECGGSGRIPS
jgi:hypothetical protein